MLCGFLSYLHALNFTLCPIKIRNIPKRAGRGMSLAVDDPEYFLSSLLQHTAGWSRPGNHIKELQAGSFYSGWREEQGAKLQSCWKNGCFPKHRRKWQMLLQNKVNEVVVAFTWLVFGGCYIMEPVAWGDGTTSVRQQPASRWHQPPTTRPSRSSPA